MRNQRRGHIGGDVEFGYACGFGGTRWNSDGFEIGQADGGGAAPSSSSPFMRQPLAAVNDWDRSGGHSADFPSVWMVGATGFEPVTFSV